MKLVKCIKERNTGDCELGKEFWMDETTIYKDSDGDSYAELYKDAQKEAPVGRRLLSRFEVMEEKCEQLGNEVHER